jgi:hypothetical protein
MIKNNVNITTIKVYIPEGSNYFPFIEMYVINPMYIAKVDMLKIIDKKD